MEKKEGKGTAPDTKLKLGTFTGVFVPNVLTILGVILFMRTGWVVGQAGWMYSLIILVIANSVTLMTALSLSAIATNSKVGGGGAYFMISRSLGLEWGGSIGVPLFLAQAVSVAFYSIGFSESLLAFFPDLNVQATAAGVVVLLFILTWKSSSIAFKTQNLIFVLLMCSLLSFFLGGSVDGAQHLESNRGPNSLRDFNFWAVFAIFFPAVTGIMAGASMSGDLKQPGKSIPFGTLASVVLTCVVYAAAIIWLARFSDRGTLVSDPLVMKSVAAVPSLIYIGLWAATLSSALASLLAAPRTLQALASDGVLPRFLARTHGENQEPRIGLVVSFGLALACVGLGKLDLIAPIISMFFLATYGMVNAVAFLESIVSNPSYRPSFKPHWFFSLVGAIGCFAIMFLLNAGATLLALVCISVFYTYLLRKRYETTWGDMRSGVWFSLTRFGLLRFAESQKHLRNWRPVILVLSGNPNTRKPLVEFANWMESKRGFLFLAQILTGDWKKLLPRAEAAEESMNEFIREYGLSAVAQVVTAESFDQGAVHLLQVAGIAPLEPNTVMLGWNEDLAKRERFKQTLDCILHMKKNLVLFIEANEEYEGPLDKTIDVWWRSRSTGVLMITLAHLLGMNRRWRRHKIRILMIVEEAAAQEQVKANLESTLEEIRIDASVSILIRAKPVHEMIVEHSCESEVCFLGINLDEGGDNHHPLQSVDAIAETFHGNVLITKNWEDLNAQWK